MFLLLTLLWFLCAHSCRHKAASDPGPAESGVSAPSDDNVGASEAHPSGELLQQAGDGAGRAGCRGPQAHGGAVGRQEDFPHGLQAGLTLRGKRTPSEPTGNKQEAGFKVSNETKKQK